MVALVPDGPESHNLGGATGARRGSTAVCAYEQKRTRQVEIRRVCMVGCKKNNWSEPTISEPSFAFYTPGLVFDYIEQLSLKYLEKDVVNFEPKLALSGGV